MFILNLLIICFYLNKTNLNLSSFEFVLIEDIIHDFIVLKNIIINYYKIMKRCFVLG